MSSIGKLNSLYSEDVRPWDKLRPSDELTLFHFGCGSRRVQDLECSSNITVLDKGNFTVPGKGHVSYLLSETP